jgi:hypothetical protein
MTQRIHLNEENDDRWDIVFTTAQPYQAEMLKSLLEEEEIPVTIMNKQDSSYLIFGEIQVLVQSQNLLKAQQIADKFRQSE